MLMHQLTRTRWLVLATLGVFAALVPTASADTAAPVWTCRATAAYVEIPGLLGDRRIEPILANGFPSTATPDTGQCASDDAGVQNVNIPAGPANNPTPLITLNAAFASTRIAPEIAAARSQTASATGGVLDTLTIRLGTGILITARAVSARAQGTCVGTTPTLTGSSTILQLSIGGQDIPIPNPDEFADINLSPLARIRLNEQVRTGSATTADEALTQRAVHVELLPTPTQPAVNIVLGEAKADRHGAVCAPPPPPPQCTPPAVAQPGSNPLVCVLAVTAPCPPNSTADPNLGGACVIIRPAPPANCPSPTVRDPATNNCILVRERPCPPGATADPATRVCVVQVVRNVGSGTNGRVGGPNGGRPTCGRLEMHFVRGGRRTLTNRFGNRVVTRGRLVTCGRNPRPIVGARIDVIHRLPDGRNLRKTGLRSRAGGRVTLILPLDLRSRRIEYAYRPDLTSARVTSRVTLRLTVLNRRGRVLR
ncbi:MAG: hypothetical protein M3296_01745 [Actinomycetota bacterium]|nr:hypothetical protein [Actinomycetota bacterium]